MPGLEPNEALDPKGPLSAAEVQRLDGVLLPALERHHLRLLAHALRTLQQVQRNEAQQGHGLPQPEAIERWLLKQPGMDHDAHFAHQLALQLRHAGEQLELLASSHGLEPLALDLEHLLTWAQQRADQRVITSPRTTPQPPPEQPPPGHQDLGDPDQEGPAALP